jgi:hypothetical protein
MNPLGQTSSEQMENADGPPPDGSTATKNSCTLRRGSPSYHTSGTPGRASKAAMSSSRSSFSDPSALICARVSVV